MTYLIIFLMILPWAATFIGSLIGLKMPLGNQSKQGLFLGFAAGIMVAATIWSLIIPAFAEAESGWMGAIITTVGFLAGCGLILMLDHITPHQHIESDQPEGPAVGLSRPMLLVMAVALHNIPEGLALGVVIASAMSVGGTTLTAAVAFGIGLALQNLPEGMAVVFPMRQAGKSNTFVAKWGILASFAEPAAALIGWAASSLLLTLGPIVMPFLLSLAGGAMMFIVVEELIPASQQGNKSHAPTFGFIAGFWVMAIMGMLTA